MRNGSLINTIKSDSIIFSVAITHDSSKIISGAEDKTIKIWKVDGTLLNTFTGH